MRLKASAAPALALPSFISPIIPSPATCPPQYTTCVPPPQISLHPLSHLFFPTQHKHLQPTGTASQGQPRQGPMLGALEHAFDTIRQEFDGLQTELVALRAQRDEYESKGQSPPLRSHTNKPIQIPLVFPF